MNDENRSTRRAFLRGCALLLAGFAGICPVPLSPDTGTDTSPRPRRKHATHATEPGYLRLHRSGELRRKGIQLWNMMRRCELCPRQCGTDRLAGNHGFCGASSELVISSYNPHFGEERPLSGTRGSGTIFMTHCNLRCVFCVNWEISQSGRGERAGIDEFAAMMLALQRTGCHNINIVTPTHYSAHLLLALDLAAERGLHIPLVYNTSGWERLEVLRILEGAVDIYLPDFKYAVPEMASRYSRGASSYPEVTARAILEMQRQTGTATADSDGLMRRGLIIRHLVMPNNVSGTREVLRWIAGNLPRTTYIHLMSQYRPSFQATQHPAINRRISAEEYADAVSYARSLGLTALDIQGYRRFN